jgi:outer membrane lipoprotein-sorting protein
MRFRHLSLLLLALAGCRRGDESSALLTDAKQRLSARDGKLTSYALAGTAHEGPQTMDFQFAYRAPQKMLGTLGAPASRTFAWDGEHLYERDDTAKRFVTYDSGTLGAEGRAGVLTGLFTPFVPEGFRVPLLPGQGVSARRTTHPRGPEAVELTVKPAGTDVEVTYVLRWPAMDFLGKRTRSGEATAEIRVEEEQCEQALALCVPRRLTQWSAGQQVADTTLSRVELNPALPAETFTLVAPGGYGVETKTLAALGVQ